MRGKIWKSNGRSFDKIKRRSAERVNAFLKDKWTLKQYNSWLKAKSSKTLRKDKGKNTYTVRYRKETLIGKVLLSSESLKTFCPNRWWKKITDHK